MKVLFQSRKTLFSVPGGDTVQVLKTAEYLKKLGVKIDISTKLEPDLKGYDLVHIFNLCRPQEAYLQAKNAKKYRKSLVLSPIYVNWEEFEKKGSGGIRQFIAEKLSWSEIEYLKIFSRAIKNLEFHKGVLKVLTLGYEKLLQQICSFTDVFLPNSNLEMERIIKDFELGKPNYVIVPNAVDFKLFDYKNVHIEQKIQKDFENCVLCVSKFSSVKNQLNIVKALSGLPYKLVFIGHVLPNHKKYFERVKKESGENVIFLGKIPHEKLPQYYKVAKVHILPSWFETTGLVSLEAAAMKCNVVITDKGYQKEYFRDYAFYCEPDNIESIRNAIIKAYESSFNEEFRKYILNNFTWEKAAEKTLEGYLRALGDRNDRKE